MTLQRYENIWQTMIDCHLEFVSDIEVDLKCVLCKNVLIKACNGPCGCRYCSRCINTYLKDEDRYCPGKLQPCKNMKLNIDNDIQEDRVANAKISMKLVKCPNQDCEFEGELRVLNDHRRVCSKRIMQCPYFNMGCLEANIVHDRIDVHLSTESYNHTNLMMEWITNLANEMGSIQHNYLQLQKENLTRKLFEESMLNEISRLQVKGDEANKQINVLQQQLKLLQIKLGVHEEMKDGDGMNDNKALIMNRETSMTCARCISNDSIDLFNDSLTNSDIQKSLKSANSEVKTPSPVTPRKPWLFPIFANSLRKSNVSPTMFYSLPKDSFTEFANRSESR